LAALRHNYRLLKRLAGKAGIVAAVKQNAYGHGLLAVAREFSKAGVSFFALESIEEALLLRGEGFKERILILSALFPRHVAAFVEYGLTPVVVDFNFAYALNREAVRRKVKVPVHVKVDTGMGRLGVPLKTAKDFIYTLAGLDNLALEGICTHFPAADTDRSFTVAQIKAFNALTDELAGQGLRFRFRHCANSAGLIGYPGARFDLVRPGLALYGIKPLPSSKVDLRPALSLKTKVIFVKDILKGDSVSYGRTWVASRNTRIATLAVGYGDGYPRALSSKARVVIKDAYFSVAGRVCMDHTMVDIGNRRDIKAGDEVLLVGARGGLCVSAQELADLAGTIPYEITTCLSNRIPRIYRNP